MSIILNAEQEAAVSGAVDHIAGRNTVAPYIVSGLAGTGKTVCLTEVVRRLIAKGVRVAVCAPTGKAANVITRKLNGLTSAKTLHGVLTRNPIDHLEVVEKRMHEIEKRQEENAYEVEEDRETDNLTYAELKELHAKFSKTNRLDFVPIDPQTFHMLYDCLIVDEASMIGKTMIYDKLISPIETPTVFFGDYGQLPPVQDKPAINLDHPSIRLTEVHRQAQDSGIIRVAHDVRNYHTVKVETFEAFHDLTAIDGTTDDIVRHYADDHQFLVWKNATRYHMNPIIRAARGFGKNETCSLLPDCGETILMDCNHNERGILKGMVGVIEDIEYDKWEESSNQYLISATVAFEHQTIECVLALTDMINEPLYPSEEWGPQKDERQRRYAQKGGLQVMWPYAITVHKAQGSEWDKVFLVGEYPSRMDDFEKWFYTGVTRAKNQLVVASDTYFRRPKKSGGLAAARARLAKVGT